MTELVIFHGTAQEASALLAAAQHNCKCAGIFKCNVHWALTHEQKLVDRLIAYRRYAFELTCQEMTA